MYRLADDFGREVLVNSDEFADAVRTAAELLVRSEGTMDIAERRDDDEWYSIAYLKLKVVD